LVVAGINLPGKFIPRSKIGDDIFADSKNSF
jgi:hypothetical protein